MCDLIFYLKNYLENNSWNFLFARAWKCNSISFVVIVIVAFCAQFILYIPSLLTESYCTLRTFDRMLFYRNASAILCRNGCLQNSYASFHITPCIRSFPVFTLFRSKSMTRVWIAVVSIRRPIVLFESVASFNSYRVSFISEYVARRPVREGRRISALAKALRDPEINLARRYIEHGATFRQSASGITMSR